MGSAPFQGIQGDSVTLDGSGVGELGNKLLDKRRCQHCVPTTSLLKYLGAGSMSCFHGTLLEKQRCSVEGTRSGLSWGIWDLQKVVFPWDAVFVSLPPFGGCSYGSSSTVKYQKTPANKFHSLERWQQPGAGHCHGQFPAVFLCSIWAAAAFPPQQQR